MASAQPSSGGNRGSREKSSFSTEEEEEREERAEALDFRFPLPGQTGSGAARDRRITAPTATPPVKAPD